MTPIQYTGRERLGKEKVTKKFNFIPLYLRASSHMKNPAVNIYMNKMNEKIRIKRQGHLMLKTDELDERPESSPLKSPSLVRWRKYATRCIVPSLINLLHARHLNISAMSNTPQISWVIGVFRHPPKTPSPFQKLPRTPPGGPATLVNSIGLYTFQNRKRSLKHRLDIVCNFEISFRLGANIVDRHAFSKLDESKAGGEMDVKYALLP